MKKLFLFSLAILATSALNVFAAPIDSYQKLTSAMLDGKKFVFLLDQKEITGHPGSQTRYFTPFSMVLTPATHSTQAHVTASQVSYIDSAQDLPPFYLSLSQDVPFYLSIRYAFYEDNTVAVTFYVYPKGMKPVESSNPPITFTTSLNKGIYVKTLD